MLGRRWQLTQGDMSGTARGLNGALAPLRVPMARVSLSGSATSSRQSRSRSRRNSWNRSAPRRSRRPSPLRAPARPLAASRAALSAARRWRGTLAGSGDRVRTARDWNWLAGQLSPFRTSLPGAKLLFPLRITLQQLGVLGCRMTDFSSMLGTVAGT